MEKSLFEQMGGTYHQESDYCLPDLSAPELPTIGVWGQRHLRYLKERRQTLYTALLLSGGLNSYLTEIDQQAEDMYSQLIKQMAERHGITEHLKATNQMRWVGLVNACKAQAEEIVFTELIFV